MTEIEAGALVGKLVPVLPDALAAALAPEEEVALRDAAAILQVGPAWLCDAATKGKVPLEVRRRGRQVFFSRGSLDALTGPRQFGDRDPLARCLADALSAALPLARAKMEPELTLTVEEAAAALAMPRKTLYRALDAGVPDLRPIRIGRRLRFSAADVARAARQK